jgi:hypothetical protein
MPVNHSELSLDALRDLGFNSNRDAHDFTPNDADLTPQRLTASLLAKTDGNVSGSIVRLVFNRETGDRVDRFVLYLRVRKLCKLQEAIDGDSRRYDARPSWYFEAWVDEVTFDPARATTVRCYFEETGEFGVMQYIV